MWDRDPARRERVLELVDPRRQPAVVAVALVKQPFEACDPLGELLDLGHVGGDELPVRIDGRIARQGEGASGRDAVLAVKEDW